MRGLLISFDGLDSSGKATQAKRLAARLRYDGWVVREFQSPDYTTESGQELKLRLQNKIGNWEETTWQEKMGFFAANRAEHRDEVTDAIGRGEIVIYDRYVPSSFAFIATEALRPQEADRHRQEVYDAVSRQEYGVNNMPQEDVSIFLDVEPRVALALLEKRKDVNNEDDEYTDHVHVQERLYNEYDVMCTNDPQRYMRIRCVEGVELLSIAATEELVWEGLVHRFPHLKNQLSKT